MNRVKPIDIAKWFMKQNIEGIDNSKDGNMKLQKLLFFSQMMYMAKNDGKTMFEEEFHAFEHGMVFQDVLWKYQKEYKTLEKEANEEIDIPEDIEKILIATKEIFGICTPEELSNMTHELKAWKKYFKKSILGIGKYNSSKSKVPYKELEEDLYRMKKILDSYNRTSSFEYEDEEEDICKVRYNI